VLIVVGRMLSVKLPTHSALITVMSRAIIKASKVLLRDFSELENLQVSVKSNRDFVTSADRNADKILMQELRRARPTYSYLSEESEEIMGEDPSHRWIVDPLDGTANYMHGYPHWAISVALEKEEEVIAAVTYDPIKNEMFWGEKGCGAYLNDKKIRVSGRHDIRDALISFGAFESNIFMKKVMSMSRIRKMGAITLDMAYLAAGRVDVLYFVKPNKWDVAAGMLLIKEAGGILADKDGRPIGNYREISLMSNLNLLEQAAQIL
jgi:myo-inositol-1(or 4)-monophosphatase